MWFSQFSRKLTSVSNSVDTETDTSNIDICSRPVQLGAVVVPPMPLLGIISMATIFLSNYVVVCYTCRPLERNWNQPRHNTFFMTLTAVTLAILICLGTVVRWVETTSISNGKGQFLCGAVSKSSHLLKALYSLLPWQPCSLKNHLILEASSFAAINARRLLLQIYSTVCSQVLNELEQCQVKKTCPRFNTKIQD